MLIGCSLMVLYVVQPAIHPSQAFMTFEHFGGAIHRAILNDALTPLGLGRKSLSTMTKGMNSQDIPFSRKFVASPQNHCDDNKIKEGYQYWSSRVQQAVIDAQDALSDRKHSDKALFEFGEAIHTVQDFYSHSNYVEWLLKNNKQMEPVDWDNIPSPIRTGYYFYGGPVSNDSFCKREKAIAGLHRHSPDLQFRSSEEYEKRKSSNSYEEALDYVLKPGELLHRELNKDGPKTMEGRILVPGQDKTLYELARKLATADTARQWLKFEKIIQSRYKEEGSIIIETLKGH